MTAATKVHRLTPLQREIFINVGPLSGVSSLALYIGKALAAFSDAYTRGAAPEVTWDFSGVMRRRMNMSALTTVLAVAERLRRFSGSAQPALLRWDPEIFAFWHDISFFRVADDFDLFDWQPAGVVGAYPQGRTNPDTEILAFQDVPPPDGGIDAWKQWKDYLRQEVKTLLIMRCGRLFTPTRTSLYGAASLRDQVAVTAAELIVNCILHAQAPAFVGLQRSTRGITVAVSDCGRGFQQTIARRPRHSSAVEQLSTIQALLAGCLMNQREMGLRRGIESVLRNGGWVTVSSDDAFIRWQKQLWHQVSDLAMVNSAGQLVIPDVEARIGPPLGRGRDVRALYNGYHRQWSYPLKGSRVSFEIPFSGAYR